MATALLEIGKVSELRIKDFDYDIAVDNWQKTFGIMTTVYTSLSYAIGRIIEGEKKGLLSKLLFLWGLKAGLAHEYKTKPEKPEHYIGYNLNIYPHESQMQLGLMGTF